MYLEGDEFINASVDSDFMERTGISYHETFQTSKQLKLLDSTSEDLYYFKNLIKLVNKEGTISPNGPLIETPDKIKLSLKIHQKRTVFEMKARENSMFRHSETHNINLLCDDVGSGKSLCILSLIADSPMAKFKTDLYYSSMPPPQSARHSSAYSQQSSVRRLYGNRYNMRSSLAINEDSIELKTNLIIIPHNVFGQWKKYIKEYTSLSAIFIGGKKDYTGLCSNKENILKKCDENDIILVKSTMYKKLIGHLNIKLGWTELNTKFNEGSNMTSGMNLRQELLKLTILADKNFDTFLGLTDTCSSTPDKISTVREDFKYMTERLNKFISSENWDNIVDNRCQRLTNNKSFIEGYYFQRVIVDEVDSIKISAFPYSFAKQIWFVSSSINNLLYPQGLNPWDSEKKQYELLSSGISGTGFLKNLLADMFPSTSSYRSRLENMRGLFGLVRSNTKFIQHSINIPPTNIHYLECYTPPHLSAIKNAISKEALKAFNAGDVSKAIEILGCSGSTEENIVTNLTKKFHKVIVELREKLVIKENYVKTLQIEYDGTIAIGLVPGQDFATLCALETTKDDIKRKINNLRSNIIIIKAKISDSEAKIEGISSRITDTDSKQCPICYCEFSNPSITPCCNNVFCIECITMALASSPKKECPLCRKIINIKDVNLIINSAAIKEPESRLKTKLETLLSIIKSKPDKRLMVFSEYNSTLNTLTEEFLSNDIDYSSIKGHSSTIERTLNNFKEKKFNVLLLNATHFGAGLNLQFTDEIIIWHRMNGDLERQVIGRAQRLGRKTPLEITYLCYDNEYQTISK